MPPSNLQEQLIKYLTDAHSIEQQALAQMKLAPKIAGDDQIAAIFEQHRTETEEHDRLVAERLEAHGARPSRLKDAAGLLTGVGFGVFALSQPDTPGKLVVHAFSYEHMEEAAYHLLAGVAERAGDPATADVARRIRAQEEAMANRVAGCFDRAAEAALRSVKPEDLGDQLNKYLADAHALEGQSLKLLDTGPQMVGDGALADAYRQHRDETERHLETVEGLLTARGGSPSALKDAALRIGALNWGAFFKAQPDTPAKLAGFSYALEHLEIGAYEMLKRVAVRARDQQVVHAAEQILAEENTAATTIKSLFDSALDATLSARRLAVS